jgi:hypothetical protein
MTPLSKVAPALATLFSAHVNQPEMYLISHCNQYALLAEQTATRRTRDQTHQRELKRIESISPGQACTSSVDKVQGTSEHSNAVTSAYVAAEEPRINTTKEYCKKLSALRDWELFNLSGQLSD